MLSGMDPKWMIHIFVIIYYFLDESFRLKLLPCMHSASCLKPEEWFLGGIN